MYEPFLSSVTQNLVLGPSVHPDIRSIRPSCQDRSISRPQSSESEQLDPDLSKTLLTCVTARTTTMLTSTTHTSSLNSGIPIANMPRPAAAAAAKVRDTRTADDHVQHPPTIRVTCAAPRVAVLARGRAP